MPDPRPHPPRPYVVLSTAASLDGRIDDDSGDRLVLSGPADLDRVDEERAACDAILVGATTVRRDDPRLLLRSPERVRARLAAGRTPGPAKVTVTAGTGIDPAARFFTAGDVPKLVHTTAGNLDAARERYGDRAEVVATGPGVAPGAVLDDLARRGVRRLLVEGGTAVQAQFLAADLVDELQLVVAPFLVGAPDAPRFAGSGRFPQGPDRPMCLLEVRELEGRVLLRYAAR